MQALPCLFALIACFLLGACEAMPQGRRVTPQAPRESPESSWTLVQLAGVNVATLERAPELQIDADGALSGFAGVNRFKGRAVPEELRRGELLAGPLAVTKMSGEARAMEAEERFLRLLGTRLAWRRNADELTLLEDGTVKARFRAAESE